MCTDHTRPHTVGVVLSAGPTYVSCICSFRIVDYLGSGNFADIHKAVWIQVGQEEMYVATKTLVSKSKKDRLRFLQEAHMMAQFKHVNIVKIHGVLAEKEPVSTFPSGGRIEKREGIHSIGHFVRFADESIGLLRTSDAVCLEGTQWDCTVIYHHPFIQAMIVLELMQGDLRKFLQSEASL